MERQYRVGVALDLVPQLVGDALALPAVARPRVDAVEIDVVGAPPRPGPQRGRVRDGDADERPARGLELLERIVDTCDALVLVAVDAGDDPQLGSARAHAADGDCVDLRASYGATYWLPVSTSSTFTLSVRNFFLTRNCS